MTTANILSQLGSPGVSTGFKNRIINGAMVIDQRNSGASVTINTSAPYIADRWNGYSDLANMTGQRTQATVPTYFTYALGITVGTGATPTAGQISRLEQRIEGFNFGDLYWGGVNAQTVTLSFWVRSSVTGTHSGALANSASNRAYPYTFTINSANTWEQKSITIAGDTTGTWLTDNGTGCIVRWNLGTGSTYLGAAGAWAATNYFGATGSVQLAATSGATFYITGVQLEVGTTATNFDVRSYGTELALCQRYYQTFAANELAGVNRYPNVGLSGGDLSPQFTLPVVMRAAPSGSLVTAFFDTWSATGGTTYTLRPSTSTRSFRYSYAASDNGGTNLAANNFGYVTTSAQTLSAEL